MDMVLLINCGNPECSVVACEFCFTLIMYTLLHVLYEYVHFALSALHSQDVTLTHVLSLQIKR